MRVLIVDDDILCAEITASIVLHCGYEATINDNGAAALRTIQSNPSGFGLVIMDLLLGDGNGLAVAKQIREVSSKVGFLFVTGYDLNEHQDMKKEIEKIGKALQKPVHRDVLKAEIDNVAKAA
ncbi:MAG: response regulator [Gammaproteobacteria bacterium]|nr:response regulator [Gammaproteobacteria bacterium]